MSERPGEPATASDLSAYVASRGRLVEEALATALPPETSPPVPLHAAMRYSVFAGGKRLRPLLVLAACEATGGRVDDALPTACAVELIHTYSLIHDDLPSMDDSLTRRGRPTCHVTFGEALAVLAGDALHALAFELLARNARTVGPQRALRVIEEIAGAIGTQGMVGGQVLDLLGEGRPELARWRDWPGDRRRGVYEIHRWKTAALIRTCLRAGGLLAGADERTLHDLTAYGEHIGLAFQVVDDILDEAGETARLGKDARVDAARSKLTFPAAFGVERSRAIAREETARAVAAIAGWGPPARLLIDLAVALLEREA
ncbi:MAG: polyprenyl synthetase family protein [Armatimonadota bacterium]|nr:polyprenyl synthetase family protein [Armatimonadota bacterium]MDR7532744.1 polyprenyl synthetase family protein [Armatimonadota bacterium]MDR7537108.1 polyprenyl synthetase family protein [Armatimonadota bacterium]